MLDKNQIKVYNSLTNKIEDFKTLKEGVVSMYVCGPTVYNHMHIGNARPVVFFDVVKRFLSFMGYKVTYASNFTDIDDKIIKQALLENKPEKEISENYIKAYLEVVEKLGCEMDVIRPKVTETMDDIISFIDALVACNAAYVSGDDVYFRVLADDKYGVLSNQKVDELEIGARIEASEAKEDPRDFTLWKKTGDEGIKWPSKFGDGRPGWHTECVVMIRKIFGGKIDIHGGGTDLRFPHHENEIAQEYVLNKDYLASFWMHNARVDLKGEKMSKSLGNVILTKDILTRVPYQALRLLLLSNHYRQVISYQEDLMQQMVGEWQKIEKAYVALYRYLELKDSLVEGEPSEKLDQFVAEMGYDFNTANAIAILGDEIKDINKDLRIKDISLSVLTSHYATLSKMLYILGLKVEINLLTEDELALVKDWQDAKACKDFVKADALREEINNRGIRLS